MGIQAQGKQRALTSHHPMESSPFWDLFGSLDPTALWKKGRIWCRLCSLLSIFLPPPSGAALHPPQGCFSPNCSLFFPLSWMMRAGISGVGSSHTELSPSAVFSRAFLHIFFPWETVWGSSSICLFLWQLAADKVLMDFKFLMKQGGWQPAPLVCTPGWDFIWGRGVEGRGTSRCVHPPWDGRRPKSQPEMVLCCCWG